MLIAAGAVSLLVGVAHAQQPIGDVLSSDSTIKGSVIFARTGPRLTSGSAVTAGSSTALVKLDRGGELRVCAGSTVTVTSTGGRNLMMSLSSGSLETHYALPATADVVMTPDFRILLAGPGQFDLAVSTNEKGDTCVHSMADSASVVVNELLGDGVYQVQAREGVIFHGGKVAGAAPDTGQCGCPPPAPQQQLTVAPKPPTPTDLAVRLPAKKAPEPPPMKIDESMTAPVPKMESSEQHLVVDAPMIFYGGRPQPPVTIARVSVSQLPGADFPMLEVTPPEAAMGTRVTAQEQPKAKKKKGFFGRIRSFFASAFGSS